MPRARNIKPGFFKNEELVELPFEHRLLFIGLWTLADRRGVLEYRPKRIKMELFPADDIDVEAAVGDLVRAGFLYLYETSTGRAPGEHRASTGLALYVCKFLKHQHPHSKEPCSDVRGPVGHPDYTPLESDLAQVDVDASTGQAPGSPDSGPADSLLLIPESLNPDPGKVGEADASPPAQSSAPADSAPTDPQPPALRMCRAPAAAEQPLSADDPVVTILPCVGTGPDRFELRASRVVEWAEAYPGVDVVGEVRRARAWLDANPKNRKTHAGMPRFLNSWLSRAQNQSVRGGGPGGGPPARPVIPFKTQANLTALADALNHEGETPW